MSEHSVPGPALSKQTSSAPVDSSVLKGIVKATGLIALVTIAARIAGFARYLVFGASVGAGDVGTAYASANLVPSVMFEVAAGGALASMVIPLIAGLPLDRSNNSDATSTPGPTIGANAVVSVVLTWTLALTTLLGIAVAMWAQPIAIVIFSAADTGGASMTEVGTRMLRVFALQLPLYAITIVCSAFLQSRKRFFWPAAAPLVSSFVVMAAYLAYALVAPPAVTVETLPAHAEAILAWGTTAGVAAMAASVALPAIREGMRPSWAWKLPRNLAAKAWSLAAAGVVAVLAQQSVIGLVLVLATRAGGTGTLPLFQYAQAVYLLPFAILIVPVMTSVFPHLSELRLVGEKNSFSAIARGSMVTVVTLGAVGGAALWGAAIGIEVFFTSIDRSAVRGVGAATAALTIGLIGYGIVMHTTRILNAQMRAKEALVVGAVPWAGAAVLILATVLTAPTRRTEDAATLFGLCIAAGMLIGAAVSFAFVEELVLTVKDAKMLRRAVAVAVGASVASALAAFLVSRLLAPLFSGAWSAIAGGALCAAIGSALCLSGIALFDREQAREVFSRVRSAGHAMLPRFRR